MKPALADRQAPDAFLKSYSEPVHVLAVGGVEVVAHLGPDETTHGARNPPLPYV